MYKERPDNFDDLEEKDKNGYRAAIHINEGTNNAYGFTVRPIKDTK